MKVMKSILIILVLVIVGVFIANFLERKVLLNNNDYKIKKGNKIFNYYLCTESVGNINNDLLYEDSEHSTYGLTIIVPWNCAICGKKDQNSTSPAPRLCKDCSNITNRCAICGKLLADKNDLNSNDI